jgi:hypothetical protein
VLLGKFVTMEYDERYGAAACAQAPLNVMIFPFQWILIFPGLSDPFLRSYNKFLTHLLYIPLAVMFTAVFFVSNLIVLPFAYLMQSIRLAKRVCITDDKSPLTKLGSFLKFLLTGPVLLLLSIPIDAVIFILNLYSMPVNSSNTEFNVPLTEDDIALFETCLDLAMQEKRSNLADAVNEKDIKKRANTEVDFVDLNRIIQ